MASLDLSVQVPLGPRPAVSDRATLGWSLAFSAFVHLAIAWRLTFAMMGLASRGEDGRDGGGGATFEVSIEGAEADVPVPAPSAPAITPASGERERVAPVARPIRVLPTRDDGAEAAASTAPTTPSDERSGPAIPSIAAAGTGAASTDSGRLRGEDDARIRALLSGSVGGAVLGGSALGDVALMAEASRCPDPVAGTWIAHRYSPEFRDWAHFTLNITRHGDELTGTIHTRMWRGMSTDTRPPPCTPSGWDYTVEMTARGAVNGDHFDFGAREHHISHVECASPMFGYNPDHFSGSFDVDRDQLRTINNDGGRDVNAAYTFRRSSCQP